MDTTRRTFLGVAAAGLAAAQGGNAVKKFVRYRHGSTVAYGLLEGDTVREIRGSMLEKYTTTNTTRKLSEVKLLAPSVPPKVFAVGLNYKSHIGNRPAPKVPEIFYKPTTSIIGPEDNIVIPPGAMNVHYEAELVIVMKRRAKNVSVQDKGKRFNTDLLEAIELGNLLDLAEVTGKRIISTRLHGNVTIREENATAALEVMSRFAANPKWLIYLPPTMSPCGTAPEGDLLEHPAHRITADDDLAGIGVRIAGGPIATGGHVDDLHVDSFQVVLARGGSCFGRPSATTLP